MPTNPEPPKTIRWDRVINEYLAKADFEGLGNYVMEGVKEKDPEPGMRFFVGLTSAFPLVTRIEDAHRLSAIADRYKEADCGFSLAELVFHEENRCWERLGREAEAQNAAAKAQRCSEELDNWVPPTSHKVPQGPTDPLPSSPEFDLETFVGECLVRGEFMKLYLYLEQDTSEGSQFVRTMIDEFSHVTCKEEARRLSGKAARYNEANCPYYLAQHIFDREKECWERLGDEAEAEKAAQKQQECLDIWMINDKLSGRNIFKNLG